MFDVVTMSPEEAGMEFRILGALEVWAEGKGIVLPGSRHQRILAALLLAPNSAVPMDRLVAAVWDDDPPATAIKQVQNCVSTLREKLGADHRVIVTDGSGYRVVLNEEELDSLRFQRHMKTAHQLASDGNLLDAVTSARRALHLWRGPALDGLSAPALAGLITHLDEQRITAIERCVDWQLELGEYQVAIDQLADLIAQHPLREGPHAQLMRALDHSGRQVDALTVFHDLRARLIDQLGVDPGSELQELQASILTKIPIPDTSAAIPVSGPGLDPDIPPARSDRAIPHLRAAIARQWTAEAELRSLNHPEPVPLTWSNTGRPVAVPATNMSSNLPDAHRGRRLMFSGNLRDLVTKFRQLPARQLVVLGAPGAGKSVLTILFTLGLLRDPQPTEPVPFLVSVASWNPYRQHLHQWLAAKLLEAHPALANRDRYGRDAATRLVLDGQIFPVLDGLDEIPPALHAAAIDALDRAIAHGRPLVVTCRADEYEQAVKQTGAVLSRAAVIEIGPVQPDAAIAFLTSRTAVGETRWKPVEDHLRHHPNGALAQALRTPLMVDLARTAYTNPDTTPAELCDPIRFSDPKTIEDHLLDTYIPTNYAHRTRPPTVGDPSPRLRTYPAADAEHWLTFLARALHHQHTQDLAWWHLDRAVPRLTASLYLGLPPGLLFLAAGWTAGGPIIGLIYGLAFAAAGCLAHATGHRREPLQVEIRFRGTIRRFLLRFTIGTAIGVIFSLGWDLPTSLITLLGLVFGTAIGLHVWLDTPIDAQRVTTPATTLRNDRTATWAYTLSFMISLSLFYGIAFALTHDTGLGKTLNGQFDVLPAIAASIAAGLLGHFLLKWPGAITYGLTGFTVGGQVFHRAANSQQAITAAISFGLAVGLTVCLARAWGRYTTTHLWLTLQRKLPLHLTQFLDDAHHRGILRQTGAAYQFRHARLQHRLATKNNTLAPPRTPPNQ